jgi:beta-ribofuranosylaminobenzene 5'-phosphate synthase
MKKVRIKTPSRLHFGVINIKNSDFNLYGSVGLALSNPFSIIEAYEKENSLKINVYREDIKFRLSKLLKYYKLNKNLEINLINEIPEHVGLGSTTQTVLAISEALFIANDLRFDPYEIAPILEIGKISGIGIGAYLFGGFLIDNGKNNLNEVTKLSFKCDFPNDWGFILIIDYKVKRISGKEEEELFKILPITPKNRIEKMLNLIEGMKDAIKERDIESFGKNLTQLQINVGLNFSSVQKDIFIFKDYIDMLKRLGAFGVGQSSWGPTIYGLFYVRDLIKVKEKIIDRLYSNVDIINSYANNYGREIKKYD